MATTYSWHVSRQAGENRSWCGESDQPFPTWPPSAIPGRQRWQETLGWCSFAGAIRPHGRDGTQQTRRSGGCFPSPVQHVPQKLHQPRKSRHLRGGYFALASRAGLASAQHENLLGCRAGHVSPWSAGNRTWCVSVCVEIRLSGVGPAAIAFGDAALVRNLAWWRRSTEIQLDEVYLVGNRTW